MIEENVGLKQRCMKAAKLMLEDSDAAPEAVGLDLLGLVFLRAVEGGPGMRGTAAALGQAMATLERANPALQGVLPTDYTQYSDAALARVLALLEPATAQDLDNDALGTLYEDFLFRHAKSISDSHGAVYTPPSVVRLMTNILEPDHGILLDPACGSGRMFLGGVGRDVTCYGQELMPAAARLCRMNLALHGLRGTVAASNTLYQDAHGLEGKCDFVLANPPYNLKNVDTAQVLAAGRLPFGLPCGAEGAARNVNYLWLSYVYAYLNDWGRAAVVMVATAADARGDAQRLRREMVETGHLEAMIGVNDRFFKNRNVGSTLWFFDKGRAQEDTLFVDARGYDCALDRTRRGWDRWQIKNLTAIVWLFRGRQDKYRALLEEYRQELGTPLPGSLAEARKMFRDRPQALAAAEAAVWLYEKFCGGVYRDIPGLCRRVSRAEMAKHEYSLNPVEYVYPVPQTDTAPGWAEVCLGDIGDLCGGLNFKADAYGPGTGIILGTDFQDRTYPDYDSLGQVRAECVKPGHELKDGDIVIARSNGTAGLVGRCMLIREPPCPVTFSHNCIRFRGQDRRKYDPEFMTYLMKTNAFRSAMAAQARDGTTKNLSQQSLGAYMIRVPDIRRQREIAAILRGYDAKIQAGERQIRSLQMEAARMFEVRFRAEGFRNCVHTPLEDLLELHYHKRPIGTEPGEIPLYSSRGVLCHVAEAKLEGEYILVPRKGDLSHVMLARGRFSANETLFCGRPKRADVTMYLYHYLLSYGLEKLDARLRKPQINLKSLNALPVPMPAEETLKAFEDAAEQCWQTIQETEQKNRALLRERDDMIEMLFRQ